MARQYQIPGADYVDETGTRQYQIPGSNYVNETGVTSVPGGGGGLLSGVAGLFLFGPISFLVGSLLTSTLATAGDKPFFNPPHFAPNHHPSGEWLNPDTSTRAAPVLGGGVKPVFVASFLTQLQHPGNEWLPIAQQQPGILPAPAPFFVPAMFTAPEPNRGLFDSTRSTPKTLFGDATTPLNVQPHFPPLRFWWQPADSSQGTAQVFRPDQVAPRVDVLHFPPLRFWWQPADSTKGVPKTLFADATTPRNVAPFFQQVQHAYREYLNPDTTQDTPKTLFSDATTPLNVSPHFPPLKFWWQPPDSSRGTPQTVRPDQSIPFKVLQQPLLVDYRVQLVHDTSRGTLPSFFPVPLPPGKVVQLAVMRYQWIMPDTSSISHPIFYPAPPPPTAVSGIRLWQAGPKGVRTRARVRFWDDDSTKT